MHLKYRNVNDAFRGIVSGIHSGSIPTEVCASRYGEVAMIEEPVIITYERPTERVLFNVERDHHPMFALYESLWMLAGKRNVAPLGYYNKRMWEFSDDDITLNDAYGYRWRHANDYDIGSVSGDKFTTNVDQLKRIIEHLCKNPESRRAVLQMWDVENDLLKIDESKAVCCNLSVCFSIEEGTCKTCKGTGYETVSGDHPGGQPVGGGYPETQREIGAHGAYCTECHGKYHDVPAILNMTVFNRSNDILWGTLSSNYVCFSILQEYMAAHLGLEVGVYNQISNNLHVYTERWRPEKWLEEYEQGGRRSDEWYGSGNCVMVPLVKDPKTFDGELTDIVDTYDGRDNYSIPPNSWTLWTEPFFSGVVRPMLHSFRAYKNGKYEYARVWLTKIVADDWRIASIQWLKKRVENKIARGESVEGIV